MHINRQHVTRDTQPPTESRAEPRRSTPSARLSARFAGQARAATSPETRLRQELHSRGLRFRVQYKVEGLARRRIDIAFTRWRVAVSVDGCFWHGCPDHCVIPKNNRDWWLWKFEVNRARDLDTDHRLDELGWTSLRVWEHEEPVRAADRVEQALLQLGFSRRRREAQHP